jgi:hypothetical protein
MKIQFRMLEKFLNNWKKIIYEGIFLLSNLRIFAHRKVYGRNSEKMLP